MSVLLFVKYLLFSLQKYEPCWHHTYLEFEHVFLFHILQLTFELRFKKPCGENEGSLDRWPARCSNVVRLAISLLSLATRFGDETIKIIVKPCKCFVIKETKKVGNKWLNIRVDEKEYQVIENFIKKLPARALANMREISYWKSR